MGFLRDCVALICGIYIGQNYNVPDVKKVVNEAIEKLKEKEKEPRQPDADA